MAIKNVRNKINVLFVLAVLVFAGAAPSYGAVFKGSSIEVIMKDDIYFNGELLSISDRTLLLYNDGVKKEFRVDIGDVKELTVHRKSPLGKRTLIGGLLGAMAAIIGLAGDDHHVENEYRMIGVPFYALIGGGLGMLSSLSTPKSKTYPIEKMSQAAVNDVLTHLSRSTWENLPRGEAVRNGLLGRFRISWRPYFNHNLKMDITGNFQLPADPLHSDPQLAARVELYSHATEYDGTHLGRIRVDYMFNKHFSLGLEYVSLGRHNIYGSTTNTLNMTRNQNKYHADFSYDGNNSAQLGLIGLNYDFPGNGGNPSGFRIETGIGLSFLDMNLIEKHYPDWKTTFNRSYKKVNLAMQLGLAIDFYPNDPISTGMYATLLYAPASFPGLKENIHLNFYDDEEPKYPDFTRDGILDLPKGKFSMEGFSLGFFIRIR
ncbi:MAG TPA: hypothetical protein VK469_09235 [Candidatus Kapabacteria bacterium]|nr:hypothetical protein [Candidatus Kapabacteria bacterium]